MMTSTSSNDTSIVSSAGVDRNGYDDRTNDSFNIPCVKDRLCNDKEAPVAPNDPANLAHGSGKEHHNTTDINGIHRHSTKVQSSESSSKQEREEEEDKTFLTPPPLRRSGDDDATKTVLQLKLMVLTILVSSAIAVGTATYMYLQRSEQTKFSDVYQDDAKKVAQSLYGGVINTLAALDLLVTTLVAHADSNNDTFPFVTMPHYANHAAKALSMSAGISVWTVVLVDADERKDWEDYAWSHRSIANETLHIMDVDPNFYGPIPSDVPLKYTLQSDYGDIPYNESRTFAPVWMLYPLQADGFPAFNWDWYTDVDPDPIHQAINSKRVIVGEPYILPNPDDPDDVAVATYWANTFSGSISPGDNPMEPVSDLIYPLINKIDKIRIMENTTTQEEEEDLKVVGIMSASFYWRDIIRNILPTGKVGLVVVIENPCTAPFTYRVDGPRTIYLGRGDLHDPKYDGMEIHSTFFDLDEFNTVKSHYTGIPINQNYCTFQVRFYPSYDMEQQFTSNNPAIFASVAVLIFIFTSIVFIIYDLKVERRQQIVVSTAARSNAVLSSLFPSNVRDKILQQENNNIDSTADNYLASTNRLRNQKFRSILQPGSKTQATETSMIKSQPIADLYSDTTVCFADICGFTAWSSTRGPDQVFILLETLYGEFDKIARFHQVFKVETIGDSYVAVAGLPEPMKTHATTMVKFAEDVLQKMDTITKDLITSLGPDTADLLMRVGLNSGPTTAGVIRGEKSRFQLFGDTVNTASRMESTGIPGRIQCTQKTAELIVHGGKGHWLSKREDTVTVKGKGTMETYWVQTSDPKTNATISTNNGYCDLKIDVGKNLCSAWDFTHDKPHSESTRQQHLIDWHIDLFRGLLMEVSMSRLSRVKRSLRLSQKVIEAESTDSQNDKAKRLPLHEVADSIAMPAYRPRNLNSRDKIEQIDPVVLTELGEYIKTIAKMYQNNPFHNFEHASHVVMSTKNLLDRMMVPFSDKGDRNDDVSIDPLARFAIAFGALIHDVDHQGVSNFQLVAEQAPIAVCYENRCVAEQNSFDLAWSLLMHSNFANLRKAIFVDDDECKRFRQVVINIVMATDIFDRELKTLRDNRWDAAFLHKDSHPPQSSHDSRNLKTTIVIEHLVQASDVIHTMQHWNVYQKWNRRLFCEMYIAHIQGRSNMDPCDNWYEGELKFFDNYILPLANKLKACNTFGTNCDAFLDFATDNRLEWEAKGRSIVTEWIRHLDGLDHLYQ